MKTLAILLSPFVLSVDALTVLVRSQRSGIFDRRSEGAHVIFAGDGAYDFPHLLCKVLTYPVPAAP